MAIFRKDANGPRPQLLVQAQRIAAGLDVFEDFVLAPAAQKRARISEIKRRSDAAAAKVLQALERGEGPAAERRRLRRCSRELEELFFCVKAAAEDMTVFQSAADARLLQMAKALRDAGERIAAAIETLGAEPRACGAHLVAARRSEQRLQTICRRSLAELVKGPGVVAVMKGRELYRRFSDAGRHGAEAADILGELLAGKL
ncbi:MAG: hypothetical protein WCI75_06905 [candidate division NC10 bacterium]